MSSVINVEAKSEPVVISDAPNSTFMPSDVQGEVERFFGIDSLMASEYKDKIDVIKEMASLGTESIGDILKNLNEMQRKIGSAYHGTEAITRLYSYAKLKKNRIELDKMISSYEVNDESK